MTPAPLRTLGSAAATVISNALESRENKRAIVSRQRHRQSPAHAGRLARIVLVMQNTGQDLKGARKVEKVELVMEAEEHIDGFVRHRRCLVGGHGGQLGLVRTWKGSR